MTRVAAVDCGTNSIRLLVADSVSTPTGTGLVDVVRRMEIVRLGHGVDRTGRIDDRAMARTLAACADYAERCRATDVERVRFVATSASRDASNAGEFIDGVRAAFGDFQVTPEVISGAVEAGLSFTGATGDLLAAGIGGPYLVVDIGGGSTELVRGTVGVDAARSTDVGCVRMTERHLHSDPPTDAEIAAATADIDGALAAALDGVDVRGLGAVVGLAGSITSVTAHALGLAAYDPAAIHLARLTVADHRRAIADLLRMPRAVRARLGFMHPGRVDVIGAGALVWSRVLASLPDEGVPVVTSEHDILDGIALSLL